MTDVLTCPSCGAQYVAAAAVCTDCGVPLGGRPLEPGGDDEVGYDLDDWDDTLRAELTRVLAADGVAHRWEGSELVVLEPDADLVEQRIDEIDHPDALDPEDDDGDGGAEILSALYVAADVLQHDPANAVAVLDLLEATEQAGELGPPYGLDRALWEEVQRRAVAVADLLGDQATDGDVATAARQLREAVRPLV
jgi:hypothetical protein